MRPSADAGDAPATRAAADDTTEGAIDRRPRPGAVGWLLLSPLLAWAFAFVALPTAILVALSLGRRGHLGGVEPALTLESWARLLSPTVLRVAARSVAFAGATTSICALLGWPVAWTIARAGHRTANLLLALVLVPFWTSFLVRTYAWVTILRGEGLLNEMLLRLGWIEAPLELLYTPGAVLLGLVHTFLPFMVLPIHASMRGIESAVVDAALDLGAGPWRTLRRVVLPLTRPGLAAGSLLVFVPALGLYALNDLLGGGRVDMLGNVIAEQFRGTARNWPFGAALSLAMLVLFAGATVIVGRGRGLASARSAR